MTEVLTTALFIAGFAMLIMVQRTRAIERRLVALSRLDAKLDLLLTQANIIYDPHKNPPRPVVEAIRQGKKIQAIKRYIEATGVGLKEGKDYVEEIQKRMGVAT